MAEKPKDKKDVKKEKPKTHNKGEMSFAMEFLLLIIALFVIWVFVGQPKTENADKPFIKAPSTPNQQ